MIKLLLALSYALTPSVPGHLCSINNPDFIEYRYQERIPYCERNVSRETKAWIYERSGVPMKERDEYTIDHIIPLAIGGSNEAENLWPEHKKVKALRPDLERELYVELRDNRIDQACAIWIVKKAKYDLKVDWDCPD